MRTLPILILGLATVLAPALSFAAGEQPGRYAMSSVEGGGVIRLDTQTGAMALCRHERGELACKPAATDDTAQRQELERLRAENQALKTEVRRLEELLLPPERGSGGKPPATGDTKPPGMPLPTEQDIDRAVDYLGRMWKRFQERMKEFEPRDKSTPL